MLTLYVCFVLMYIDLIFDICSLYKYISFSHTLYLHWELQVNTGIALDSILLDNS